MNIYSGCKLSEVPFSEIHLGMEVISVKGTLGKVSGVRAPGYKDEDNDILIGWVNGNHSDGWHFQMDKVIVK
jgi:hypothetical protein